jgi:hypothetical protein
MDHNGVVRFGPAAGRGKCQRTAESIGRLRSQPTQREALRRQKDEHTIEEIIAAKEAIAASPHRPEPRKAYKLLPPKDTTGGPEPLQLVVTVRRLQIVSNGFIVSYTVREYERLVYLEDLDLPLKYRIPKFQ